METTKRALVNEALGFGRAGGHPTYMSQNDPIILRYVSWEGKCFQKCFGFEPLLGLKQAFSLCPTMPSVTAAHFPNPRSPILGDSNACPPPPNTQSGILHPPVPRVACSGLVNCSQQTNSFGNASSPPAPGLGALRNMGQAASAEQRHAGSKQHVHNRCAVTRGFLVRRLGMGCRAVSGSGVLSGALGVALLAGGRNSACSCATLRRHANHPRATPHAPALVATESPQKSSPRKSAPRITEPRRCLLEAEPMPGRTWAMPDCPPAPPNRALAFGSGPIRSWAFPIRWCDTTGAWQNVPRVGLSAEAGGGGREGDVARGLEVKTGHMRCTRGMGGNPAAVG